MFDIPYMIQSNVFEAGPFRGLQSTTTVSIYIYDAMINKRDYGIASAASVILFAFSLILSVIMYFTFFKEKNHEKKIMKRISKA